MSAKTQNEPDVGIKEELREPEKRILQVLDQLQELKERGDNLVSNVRVEGDHAEQERRINQDVKIEALQQKLQSEAISSAKRNAAVNMKWSALKQEIKIPQNLQKAIDQQIENCKKIIESKDRLIREIQNELRNKDAEYMKALKQQAKDIDTLIQRMHNQIKELTTAFEKNLEEIEQSFMQERENLLKSHREEIEELEKTRQDQEAKYINERIKDVQENEIALERLRETELEKYAKKKKELDKDLHELEQQIDSMFGLYQLSAEKLEYNFQVLTERVNENEGTVKNNKGKAARLQDQLSGIKAKYAKDDAKYKQENQDITEQYKRIAKLYKETLAKFRYFEETDLKRFRDIWRMNEETVNDLAKQLLQADKVITEQQLGLQWTKPSEDFFKTPALDATNPDITQTASISDSQSLSGSVHNVAAQPLEVTEQVLKELCENTGFLVEEKVRNVMKELDPDEAHLLKLDAVLKALGIENSDDINKLVNFFIKEGEEAMKESQTKTSPDEIPMVSPDQVIKVLKKFVDAQQKYTVSSNIKQKKTRMSAKQRERDRRREEERKFWERMAQVIPDKKYKIWLSLEKALEEYKDLLTDRAKLIEETEAIRTQNNELRELLNQYLSQGKKKF